MINRALIRLKIVQIIYSYYQNGNANLEKTEKELFFSLSKSYDLYHYLLLLMVEVTRYAEKQIEVGKQKVAPTPEERHPNTKFIENAFIAQLANNEQLAQFVALQKKSWERDGDFLRYLYDKIASSDIYTEYMATSERSYEEDRELWRKLYRSIIMNDARIDEILEDQSLYWNDDKEIVDTFVLKTIKRFQPANGAEQTLLPEYKSEEDKTFASHLFRRTILNEEYYRQLMSETSKNWKLDRIAVMDLVIMQTALAEITSFPNIPTKVSLNEYVDIAKLYSTPRSGSFVNATLDTIVKRLKAENKLMKE